MNPTSYPTKKIQELLESLFYEFGNGEIHWPLVEGVPVQDRLKYTPEMLKLFMDIWNYNSSPTTTTEDEE